MNIKVIYSRKHKGHNPPYELYDGVYDSYAEKPERIESIVKVLQERGFKMYPSHSFSTQHIYDIHQKEYVQFVKKRSENLSNNEILYPSYFIMDTYTPITEKTYEAAKISVDIALSGAEYVLNGEKIVYSLCRPPGHHAEHSSMGGYCYFNNAAIAAEYLSKQGRVAILDIDFHHGNGTQHIFYERPDVLYVSLHADPHKKFPYSSGFFNEQGKGRGEGFNKNYPLRIGTTNTQYRRVLQKALRDIADFHPQFLIVSAGFDTYENDPIGGFRLTIPFYKTIGQQITSLLVPTLIVQEGGYNIDFLGQIAYSFLDGIRCNM